MNNTPTVEVAPWKNDAAFVYSITYDEATIDVIWTGAVHDGIQFALTPR